MYQVPEREIREYNKEHKENNYASQLFEAVQLLRNLPTPDDTWYRLDDLWNELRYLSSEKTTEKE